MKRSLRSAAVRHGETHLQLEAPGWHQATNPARRQNPMITATDGENT